MTENIDPEDLVIAGAAVESSDDEFVFVVRLDNIRTNILEIIEPDLHRASIDAYAEPIVDQFRESLVSRIGPVIRDSWIECDMKEGL